MLVCCGQTDGEDMELAILYIMIITVAGCVMNIFAIKYIVDCGNHVPMIFAVIVAIAGNAVVGSIATTLTTIIAN